MGSFFYDWFCQDLTCFLRIVTQIIENYFNGQTLVVRLYGENVKKKVIAGCLTCAEEDPDSIGLGVVLKISILFQSFY